MSTPESDLPSSSSPAALSDEAIVARVLSGESALFELLMRRHNQRLYRVVRAVLSDEDEVEDVMQQAYLAAYTHLAQFRAEARFSTWLARIALHEALARRRASGRLVSLEDLSEQPMKPPSAQPTDPERAAGSSELARLLEAAIGELPETYRLVVMLRDVEGLSTAEAAACLEVSEDVVKQRLHRARLLLREELAARVGARSADAFVFQAPRCDRVVAAVLARLPPR